VESRLNQLSEKLSSFETVQFTVAPLSAVEAHNLLIVLLCDAALASQVPWLRKKSQHAIQREAFDIAAQSADGELKIWGIVAREQSMEIGAVIARNSDEGVDVEVLVASRFWQEGIADEVTDPVIEWLSNNFDQENSATLH
jgi:Acetyltransferase (GNAT) domain